MSDPNKIEFAFQPERRSDVKPPICIVYGPEGTGKTTLVNGAERVLMLNTEDGAGEMEQFTLKDGVFESYEEYIQALRYVYKNHEELNIKYLATDSLDHLEKLVDAHSCNLKGWASIGEPGFGKGPEESAIHWAKIISSLQKIRDDLNIGIIMISHEQLVTVHDPLSEPYTSHTLKLNKHAVSTWVEHSDMIGLLRVNPVKDDKGRVTSGTPKINFTKTAAFTGKCRYTIPRSIDVPKENGWVNIEAHIPFYNQDT